MIEDALPPRGLPSVVFYGELVVERLRVLTENEHYQRPAALTTAERGRRGPALRQWAAPTTGRTSWSRACAGVRSAIELADLHLPARASCALGRGARDARRRTGRRRSRSSTPRGRSGRRLAVARRVTPPERLPVSVPPECIPAGGRPRAARARPRRALRRRRRGRRARPRGRLRPASGLLAPRPLGRRRACALALAEWLPASPGRRRPRRAPPLGRGRAVPAHPPDDRERPHGLDAHPPPTPASSYRSTRRSQRSDDEPTLGCTEQARRRPWGVAPARLSGVDAGSPFPGVSPRRPMPALASPTLR